MSDEHDMLARIDRRLPGPVSSPTPDPATSFEIRRIADDLAHTNWPGHAAVLLDHADALDARAAERACLLAIKDAAEREHEPGSDPLCMSSHPETKAALAAYARLSALPEDQTP